VGTTHFPFSAHRGDPVAYDHLPRERHFFWGPQHKATSTSDPIFFLPATCALDPHLLLQHAKNKDEPGKNSHIQILGKKTSLLSSSSCHQLNLLHRFNLLDE
jgi:hypothetical protein